MEHFDKLASGSASRLLAPYLLRTSTLCPSNMLIFYDGTKNGKVASYRHARSFSNASPTSSPIAFPQPPDPSPSGQDLLFSCRMCTRLHPSAPACPQRRDMLLRGEVPKVTSENHTSWAAFSAGSSILRTLTSSPPAAHSFRSRWWHGRLGRRAGHRCQGTL